jgi:hypothetical protein
MLTDIDYEHGKSETFDRAALRIKSVLDIFYNPKWNTFLNYKRDIPKIAEEDEDLEQLKNIAKEAHALNPEGKQQYFDPDPLTDKRSDLYYKDIDLSLVKGCPDEGIIIQKGGEDASL